MSAPVHDPEMARYAMRRNAELIERNRRLEARIAELQRQLAEAQPSPLPEGGRHAG